MMGEEIRRVSEEVGLKINKRKSAVMAVVHGNSNFELDFSGVS